MAVKDIVKVPEPILTKETKKVNKIDQTTKALIQDLSDTLNSAHDPEGAGIAAPQIGSNSRICIVRRFIDNPNDKENPLFNDYILINPKIIEKSPETQLGWEGCLSIPDTYGRVPRHKKIKIKALNEKGEEVKINASGFFARVAQHEIDHLDGSLFTSKVVGKTYTDKELDELFKKEEAEIQ